VESEVLEIKRINSISLNPQVKGKLENFISNSTVSLIITTTSAAVIYRVLNISLMQHQTTFPLSSDVSHLVVKKKADARFCGRCVHYRETRKRIWPRIETRSQIILIPWKSVYE
jgi:hypothetical protein